MANTTNDITMSVGLDPTDFTRTAKNLGSVYGKIWGKSQKAINDQIASVGKLQDEMYGLTDTTLSYQKQMDILGKLKVLDTSAIKEAQASLTYLTKKKAMLDAELSKRGVQAKNVIGLSDSYKEVVAEIEQTEQKLATLTSSFNAHDAELNDTTMAYEQVLHQINELSDLIPVASGKFVEMWAAAKHGGEDTAMFDQFVAQLDDMGSNAGLAEEAIRRLVERENELAQQQAAEEQADMIRQISFALDDYAESIRNNVLQAQQEEENMLSQIGFALEDYADTMREEVIQAQQEEAEMLRQIGWALEDYYDGIRQENLEEQQAQRQQRITRTTQLLTSAFRGLGNTLKDTAKTMGNFTKKALSFAKVKLHNLFKKITGETHRTSKGLGNATSMLKKFILAGIGVRSIYFLFRKFWNMVKDGVKIMAQVDADTNKALSNIKTATYSLQKQFGSLGATIVQAVAPAITYVINLLTKAIEYATMFFAALTGKSTYKKATTQVQDYAASLDSSSKSAKKANDANKKYLSGLDEIARWEDKNDDSGSGAYEDVPIDSKLFDWLEKLKKMWEDADFTELGKKLGTALRNLLNNVPWKKIRENAYKLGKSFATLANGFIEVEGLANSIGRTFAQALNTLFEAIYGFVHNFHWSSLGKFIGDELNGFFTNIDWNLIYNTFVEGFTGLGTSIQSFIERFNWNHISSALSFAVNTISDSVLGFLDEIDWYALGYKLGEQLKKTIEEIDWEKVGRALGKIIKSALDFLEGFIDGNGGIKETLKRVGEAIIKALKGSFEEIGTDGFGELCKIFLTLLGAKLALKAVGFGFTTAGKAIIKALIGSTTAEAGTASYGGLVGRMMSGISESWVAAGGLKGIFTTDLVTMEGSAVGWAIGGGIIGGIIAAVGGFKLGEYMSLKDLPEEDRKFYEDVKENGGLLKYIFGNSDEGWFDGIVQGFSDIGSAIRLMVGGALTEEMDLANQAGETAEHWHKKAIEWAGTESEAEAKRHEQESRNLQREHLLNAADIADKEGRHKQAKQLREEAEKYTTTLNTQTITIEDETDAKTLYWDVSKNSLSTQNDENKAIETGITDMNNYETSISNTGIEVENLTDSISDTKIEVENLSDTANDSASTFESFGSRLKDVFSGLLESAREKFGKIGEYISNAFSGTSGTSQSYPNITFQSSAYNVPHLAQGAVLPANQPFLAMLGDQKSGTNIEAPLSTIKQAVAEVVGSNSGGNYQFTAQLNRRVLFDEFIAEAKLRQSASGRNPFEFA